jgi:hypothetical protein
MRTRTRRPALFVRPLEARDVPAGTVTASLTLLDYTRTVAWPGTWPS